LRWSPGDEAAPQIICVIPLGGKMLAPDQIARTAVFPASEEAGVITAQVLHANGGTYLP